MTPQADNLFENIPALLHEEHFHTIAQSRSVTIERIVSKGHATPQGEWSEQNRNEWVLLVSGGATLLFADSAAPLNMKPGDHVMIPAGCRHRVEQTEAGQKTVWLAVHYDENCIT